MTTEEPSNRELSEAALGYAQTFLSHRDGAIPYYDAASSHALMAIYYELRHGNNQTAAHTDAVAKQTRVMGDLAGQLEKVAMHLGDR